MFDKAVGVGGDEVEGLSPPPRLACPWRRCRARQGRHRHARRPPLAGHAGRSRCGCRPASGSGSRACRSRIGPQPGPKSSPQASCERRPVLGAAARAASAVLRSSAARCAPRPAARSTCSIRSDSATSVGRRSSTSDALASSTASIPVAADVPVTPAREGLRLLPARQVEPDAANASWIWPIRTSPHRAIPSGSRRGRKGTHRDRAVLRCRQRVQARAHRAVRALEDSEGVSPVERSSVV